MNTSQKEIIAKAIDNLLISIDKRDNDAPMSADTHIEMAIRLLNDLCHNDGYHYNAPVGLRVIHRYALVNTQNMVK